MAREVRYRLEIEGAFKTESPIHVGAMGGGGGPDLPIARDGAGRPYVPGTSLAGVLRERVAKLLPAQEELLFGFVRDTEGKAASFAVQDAEVIIPEGMGAFLRDGVGIDREWGSAAYAIKFDVEVLPVGTVIPLRAVLETEEVGGGACREAVGHLLRSVRDEGLTVGAGSTRGLGRLKLQERIALLEFDLGSREGILALLRRRANCGASSRSVTIGELVGGEPSLIPRPRAKLGVTIAWEPDGPLMVKSGSEGLGVDALPLVEPRDGGLRLVVPGSSVKGVLRSHAERIVRTVLDRNLPDGSVPKHERHLTQVGVPLVTELFGDAPGKARGRKGALTVWDISASWLSPIAWEQVLAADTPEKAQRIADSNAPSKVDVTVHVAVDRWTGGAARGLLYSGFEPFGPAFSELRLEVDLDLLPASLRNPASALVLLLLDDLARGVIALGYATNRGMGALKISSVVVTGLGSPTNPDTFQVELPRGPDSVAEAPGPVLVAARQQPWFSELAEAWAEWLQAERSRNAMGEQSRA